MERFEVFDPATYQPYGTADQLADAVAHALREAPGRWVVVDAEYGRIAAQGHAGVELSSSAETFETYGELLAHVKGAHHLSTLALVDAGDPDFDGLAAWHNEIHVTSLDKVATIH